MLKKAYSALSEIIAQGTVSVILERSEGSKTISP